jgi:hypothetical protein
LDWDSNTAPILTDYMGRMLIAGYYEGYRRSCLGHALRIYESMVLDDIEAEDQFIDLKTGIDKREELMKRSKSILGLQREDI